MHEENQKAARARLAAACTVMSLWYAAQPVLAVAAAQQPVVEIGPRSSDTVAVYTTNLSTEPRLSYDEKLKLLRRHVKYVFVLYQENRSFDFHLGTFPGADGLFS